MSRRVSPARRRARGRGARDRRRSRARARPSCRPRRPGAPRSRARAIGVRPSAGTRRSARRASGGRRGPSTVTGWNVPSPTCSVTLATSHAARREPAEQRVGQVQPRGRRRDRAVARARRRSGSARVVGLVVALDVRRQRDVAARASTRLRRRARPTGGAERDLEQARRPPSVRARHERAGPHAAPPGRIDVARPDRSGFDALPSARHRSAARTSCPASPSSSPQPVATRSTSTRPPVSRLRPEEARGDDARVVDDDERARARSGSSEIAHGRVRRAPPPASSTSRRAPSRSGGGALRR